MEEFQKAIDFLVSELSKLRTGRANPALIEDLKVDYYGTPTPIKQLGSISVPEARQLLVQPWDKNALAPIEKGIRDSGLGLNPTNEGDKLRINLPDLNEERRKELTKLVGKLAEETRVRIRNVREAIMKDLKQKEEAGTLSEDAKTREQKKLQEQVDDFNKKIKEIVEKKEQEIMTV